tara:strand:+ start:1102 stop:2601 length:1500 start_codon:yes stop_codon:yes gene_type:complete
MDYPIFKGRHILNMMEPFISLKAYGTGDVILAKGEPAQWVGWLIDGESMYTATYTFEDLREERTTIESQVMIGLVGTLFNLPSLIHHTARTTCVIAQVRKETFNQCLGTDTGPDPSLIEIIERLDFENSFDVTRECLCIETVFGYPWWHVFGARVLSLDDRIELAWRILESSPCPEIVTNLSRNVNESAWTPIDLATKIGDHEIAKILIHYGARIRPVTIRLAVHDRGRRLLELNFSQLGAVAAANKSLLGDDSAYAAKLQDTLEAMSSSVRLGISAAIKQGEAIVPKASSHPIIKSTEGPMAMPEPTTKRNYKTVLVKPTYVPRFYAFALVLLAITRWKKLVPKGGLHKPRFSQRRIAEYLAPKVVYVTVFRRKEQRSHTVISTPTRSPEVHDEVENLSSPSMTAETAEKEMEYADMVNATITTGMGDERSRTAENVLGDDKLRKMQPTPKLFLVQKPDSISREIDMSIDASASGGVALANDVEEHSRLFTRLSASCY